MIVKIMDGSLDYDMISTKEVVTIKCLFTVGYYKKYKEESLKRINELEVEYNAEIVGNYFQERYLDVYEGNIYAIIFGSNMIMTCGKAYLLNDNGQTIERTVTKIEHIDRVPYCQLNDSKGLIIMEALKMVL